MASTIIETPLAPENRKLLKERERRAREAAAFRELRDTLESADSKAFWRMEKVDIIEGAVYLIRRLAGGSTVQLPARPPIVFDTERNEKIDRVQVEKIRRSRESEAVKNLKDTLITYFKNSHAKMDKVEVLIAAAEFLKTLTGKDSLNGINQTGTDGISPLISSSGSSPTSSLDSGSWSMTSSPVMSPEMMIISSMMMPSSFIPMNYSLAFDTTNLETAQDLSSTPSTTKTQSEVWRPWE